MNRSAARSGVLVLAVASLLIATPASATTAAAPDRRVQFDTDDFQLSSSGASASGTVSWSRRGRSVQGRVSGSVDGNGKCLRVTWLDSANSSIGSSSACDREFGLSFSSPSLQCVLIRLGSASRQLCAGGS